MLNMSSELNFDIEKTKPKLGRFNNAPHPLLAGGLIIYMIYIYMNSCRELRGHKNRGKFIMSYKRLIKCGSKYFRQPSAAGLLEKMMYSRYTDDVRANIVVAKSIIDVNDLQELDDRFEQFRNSK